MTYAKQGDNITLQMTSEDYARLLLILGYATGACMRAEGRSERFYRWIQFVNDLNTGNPQFIPYASPKEWEQVCR